MSKLKRTFSSMEESKPCLQFTPRYLGIGREIKIYFDPEMSEEKVNEIIDYITDIKLIKSPMCYHYDYKKKYIKNV